MAFFTSVFVIIPITWILSGFVSYGLVLGAWTKEFPYMNNKDIAIRAFFGGLCSLTVLLLVYTRIWNWNMLWRSSGLSMWRSSGLSWRLIPVSLEERWKVYNDLYPNLVLHEGYTFEDFKKDYR